MGGCPKWMVYNGLQWNILVKMRWFQSSPHFRKPLNAVGKKTTTRLWMLGRLAAVFLDTRHGERNGLPSFSHCPPGIQLGNRQSSTGWWFFYPSEKYDCVNWDDDIPNIWENKKWQPNHQPVHVELIFPLGVPFSSWISQPCLMTPAASCPNEKFQTSNSCWWVTSHWNPFNKPKQNHRKSYKIIDLHSWHVIKKDNLPFFWGFKIASNSCFICGSFTSWFESCSLGIRGMEFIMVGLWQVHRIFHGYGNICGVCIVLCDIILLMDCSPMILLAWGIRKLIISLDMVAGPRSVQKS